MCIRTAGSVGTRHNSPWKSSNVAHVSRCGSRYLDSVLGHRVHLCWNKKNLRPVKHQSWKNCGKKDQNPKTRKCCGICTWECIPDFFIFAFSFSKQVILTVLMKYLNSFWNFANSHHPSTTCPSWLLVNPINPPCVTNGLFLPTSCTCQLDAALSAPSSTNTAPTPQKGSTPSAHRVLFSNFEGSSKRLNHVGIQQSAVQSLADDWFLQVILEHSKWRAVGTIKLNN